MLGENAVNAAKGLVWVSRKESVESQDKHSGVRVGEQWVVE